MDTHIRKPRKKEGYTPKSVIARAYAPELTPTSARNRLNLWMRTCTPLWNALKRAGYSENAKKFSPRHLQLIYKHLGTPPNATSSRIAHF